MGESEKKGTGECIETKPQYSEEKMNLILRGLARLVCFSAKKPLTMFAVIAIITVIMYAGASTVKTTGDQLDILPTDDQNTISSRNWQTEFPESYNTVGYYLVIDPEKWDELNANLPSRMTEEKRTDCTDELYIRGLHEFYEYMKMKVPSAKYEIGPSGALMIINWSNSALTNVLNPGQPDPNAFSMPGTGPDGSFNYMFDESLLMSQEAIQLSFSADHTCISMNILFDAGGYGLTSAELGKQIIKAMDEWPAWAEENATFAAFKYERTTANQVPVCDGRAAELSELDNQRLMPIVIGFLLLCLIFSFRKLSYVIVGFVALILALIWTLGIMGYAGIPFTNLNQTIVPLILGCGIDYSLHMIIQFMQHKSRGCNNIECFKIATGRSGFAMFLSMATTVIGMSSLMFSPSRMMQQLGIVAPTAMFFAMILNMTFTPAAISFFNREKAGAKPPKFVPAKNLTKICGFIGKHRVISVMLVLAISGLLFISSMNLRYEEFGDPQMNFLPGDKVRTWREMENENFYGGKTSDTTKTANFLIFEADMTQPAVHTYMRSLAEHLSAMPDQAIGQIMCLPWMIDNYLTVRDGTLGAGVATFGTMIPGGLGTQMGIAPEYPQTQSEIKQVLDEMRASPFWSQASLFLNNDYTMTILPIDLLQYPHFEGVERGWNAVWNEVEEVDNELGRPEGTIIAFSGLTAFSYLFITYEAPWVTYVTIISAIAVTLLILIFTRNVKATIIVGIMMYLTGTWWFGVLPLVDIGISVNLMLPVTFITSMGSNYAVLLVWNLTNVKDRESIYHSIGKSVMFSAITTIGAFSIFSFMSDLMSRKTMLSVALATTLAYICTMLVISIVYPPYPRQKVDKKEWHLIKRRFNEVAEIGGKTGTVKKKAVLKNPQAVPNGPGK